MSEPKHILFISTFYGKKLGGAEISVKLLFDALKNTNVDVKLVTIQSVLESNVISLRLGWIPKKVFILGNIFLDNYISFRLRGLLKMNTKINLLHVQDIFSLPATVKAAKSLDVPVIATIRDNLPREYNILGFNIFRWRNRVYYNTLLDCQAIVAISHSVRTHLINFGVPAEKIHVIYNIAPSLQVKDSAIENDIPIILALGRMNREKGFHVLLKALSSVDKDCVPFVLHLVGDGSEKRNLQLLARNLGIENKVKFLPWIDKEEVYSLYAKCDLVVLPSIYEEPFGRVALEAATCGKPVIASRVGGLPEIIQDGVTGILISANDPDLLGEAISSLVCKADVRQSLGEKAKILIGKKFSASAISEKFQSLYKQLR